MLLDESEAATILKHLGPDEVKGLAKAMYDTANATESQIEQALDSFVARSRSVSALAIGADTRIRRPEEHTYEFQSLMRISYDVFCLKKTTTQTILNKAYTSIIHGTS